MIKLRQLHLPSLPISTFSRTLTIFRHGNCELLFLPNFYSADKTQFNPGFIIDEDEVMRAWRRTPGRTPRRFDEHYRCYPVAMMPGPERESANHGGKVFLPPSALDKLTRLHITYPMLFEVINGAKERTTHAGVLEFIAEEGKIYLPFWVRNQNRNHITCNIQG